MWKYILDLFNGKRMGTVPLPDSDLTGKVAIVTGASDGIGTETCRGLALLGAHVIMAVRNLKKGEEKAALINEELQKEGSKGSVELMRIDVSDQDSVRSFVEEFKKKKLPLHILVDNAGSVEGGLSPQGFELVFATNHLGPYLLTRLLLEKLKESSPSRIVIVSSMVHGAPKAIKFEELQSKTTRNFYYYCISKLANAIFGKSLAEQLKGTGVNVYTLHPGTVISNIWGFGSIGIWIWSWLFITNRQGAQTSIYCAADKSLDGESGKYYEYCQEKPYENQLMEDDNLSKELWNKCSEWTGLPS
eukprot:TRINITY_DN1806_c0_g1_i1.p1 TRINITY_DN1806_c0_g1~~TRINITY_DN1806_c0_g1_i1.p1  ORF type:complete len:303 (-),score=73.11 TRINITY_DN1806_c0_g1_i1:64-972(-)